MLTVRVMRASDITTFGGGRPGEQTSSFKIGRSTITVSGDTTEDNRYVAEELARAWNRDEEPDAPAFTSDADDVAALCARLLRGPVTSSRFSVGPWTPAVDDGFAWAVLDRNGAPLMLAHDAFEVALYFCRLEEGTAEVEGFPIEVPTDTELADRKRWDRWFEEHRFRGPMGDPNFIPFNPYQEVI